MYMLRHYIHIYICTCTEEGLQVGERAPSGEESREAPGKDDARPEVAGESETRMTDRDLRNVTLGFRPHHCCY